MISKVQRIKTIGKFYDYAAKGTGLDWGQNTFLFAPNAYGKSTLVNVLRSLKSNDAKIIKARKTLDKVAPPEAVVIVDGVNHVFNGARWDKPYPNIRIFDVPFIHDNILSHEIEHSHRKRIHRIIIGAQGIKLSSELATLKNLEKAKNREVTDLDAQFASGGFTIGNDAFVAIPATEEIAVGARIQKLEQAIKAKESEATVQGLGLPIAAKAPVFDLSTAKTLAGKKLAAVHEEAEKQVLAHIDRNFKAAEQARTFIRQGVDLMTADCPFCGQDLKGAAALLKAYQEFFDDSFRNYQAQVSQQGRALNRWNIDNELTAQESTHNANIATLRQWEAYLGTTTLPDIASTVQKARARLRDLRGKAQEELAKKLKDPNAVVDISVFDQLSGELSTLSSAVDTYNSEITSFVEKAKKYRAGLPKSDVASLKATLAKEQQTRLRFTLEWKKWATDYPVVKKDAGDLRKKKESKQKELEDYGKTIFDTYQARINALLATLGADFRLTDLKGKTDERANESYSDFVFLILEKTVPLKVRQDDAPCFNNTLSEGDKSTLAFAFFIAAVETIPELDKQVVILDDPLSSLDETRREATARVLLELSPKLNQLAVFTHKKDFLHMLFDKIPSSITLQIRSDRTKGSWLEPFDVEEDRKSQYARTMESLQRYVSEDYGPTADSMQGNIRKAFEVVLKTKYYCALIPDIRQKKGLAKLLKTLFAAGLLHADLKSKLFDLCNVTNGPHHGDIFDAPAKTLTRAEVVPLIEEALTLLETV